MKERNGTGVVFGALAFDARVADAHRKRRLEAADAEALVEAVHRNLVADCPDGRSLRLTLGAAYYDACELLRIGWPLHRRLRALSNAAATPPRDARLHRPALPGHDGLPEPQGCASGQALLTLPFVLEGEIEPATETLRHLDRNRMLAYTPRARHVAFELPTLPAFDAVGYFSMRSLSAELAGRYYSVGLGGVWSLIERVLFAPKREHEWYEAPKREHEWYEAPKREHERYAAPEREYEYDRPKPSLRYADGRVRLHDDGHERVRRWRDLLQAHGVPLEVASPNDAERSAAASA